MHCALGALAQDLDVGLSQPAVAMVPTYVTKSSQRSFRIVNRSTTALSYAVSALALVELARKLVHALGLPSICAYGVSQSMCVCVCVCVLFGAAPGGETLLVQGALLCI